MAAPGRNPWVVIGCGRMKRPHPAPALDLYCSTYIRSAARWARSVTVEDHIVVFSAKYGLIDASTVIEPYDVSFRTRRGGDAGDQPVSTLVVGDQAAALGLDGDVITIAGAVYRQRLDRATNGKVRPFNPFTTLIRARGDVPGIGRQIQAMNEWTGRIPDAPPS